MWVITYTLTFSLIAPTQLQHEAEVVSLLRSEIIRLLSENCSCHYPEKKLHRELLIPMCVEDEDSTEPHIQLIFRARLLTMVGHSEGELAAAIESWKSSLTGALRVGGESLTLKSSRDCPTRIDYATQPLCRTERSAVEKCSVEKCPVSVPNLVAFLLTEFAFMSALLVISVVAAVCITKSRRKRSDIG